MRQVFHQKATMTRELVSDPRHTAKKTIQTEKVRVCSTKATFVFSKSAQNVIQILLLAELVINFKN